ncbi:protein SPEAR3-like [Populus alba x Populus x berolinensis]|nr:protein SPEAR3-like [Populus alba x Populus x berolinensis]
MDSGYFGEPNFGNNERGGSSRKGKKSNSDKPKQPQRGLGVAQLEKIRLHGQIGCNNYHPSLHSAPYPTAFNQQEDIRVQTGYSPASSSSFSYSSSAAATSASYGYPHTMMGIGDYDGTNIRYGDSQPSTAASWNSGHGIHEAQHYAQPNSTRHLLPLQAEDTPPKKTKKHRSSSMGSSSQNSEASDTQELDLELRLSI